MFFPRELLARNLSQRSGTKGGAPRSPARTPGSSSAAADQLTQLERSFNDLEQTSILVLSDRIESNGREKEWLHEILEDWRNSEVGTYARVGELNELRTMLDQQMRQCANPTR